MEKPLIYPVIDFTFEDKPFWLDVEEQVHPDKMVANIVERMKLFEEMKKKLGGQEAVDAILADIRYDFIHHMAKEEKVGVQDEAASKELLMAENDIPRRKKELSKREQVTINMQKALNHFTWLFNTMENTGMLDEEYVITGHRILMTDTGYEFPGQLSEYVRSTEYPIGVEHIYPPPEVIPGRHHAIVDHVNDLISYVTTLPLYSTERITATVKLASWLLFEYVDLHPFGDGNGRMCRLLCCYVLFTIAPFPTSIYNIHGSSSRDDYVKSLIETRRSETRHPRLLATMLLECLWKHWKYVTDSIHDGLNPRTQSAPE